MGEQQAPGSVAMSDAGASWAQAPASEKDGQLNVFKKTMMEEVKKINDKWGGPGQYLAQMTIDEKVKFTQHLWEAYPERDDLFYNHSATIPPVNHKEIGVKCAHTGPRGGTWI